MSGDILFSQEGQLGFMTLNRPNALNALNLPMILSMQKQLELWKKDRSIAAVVLRAVPGKAFCAGGDVRALYAAGKAKDPELMQFFWHEYRLNHYIHHFGKPYIALMDGLVMGGGVGIALHGSHPVAGERFSFAMPETAIGFFPDIGASHLLNRCPGALGLYLALTGERLNAEAAQEAGLVSGILSSDRRMHFLTALQQMDLFQEGHEQVSACLQSMTAPVSGSRFMHPLIDSCFEQTQVECIASALKDSDCDWSRAVLQNLQKKSPLSLKITLEQLHRTQHSSLAECLKLDYNLVGHFLQATDFYEGVRALLIDKDQRPQWEPARLDLVRPAMVLAYFDSCGQDLQFIDS